MSLTDGDVADLARHVVDAIDPSLEVQIAPADVVDPYRFGAAAWTITAGGASSHVTADMSPEDARARLTADLTPS